MWFDPRKMEKSKTENAAYMREYRKRPGVRERELERKRDYDALFRLENRERWSAHNKKPARRRARREWYQANRARILAERKARRASAAEWGRTFEAYAAKFGPPPKGYVITKALMVKSLKTGSDEYSGLRKAVRLASRRRAATRRSRADFYKQVAKERKIRAEYLRKFGGGFASSDDTIARMEESLATGKDAFAKEKREVHGDLARIPMMKKIEAYALANATDFTAKDERQITALVKNRKLYEGACFLPWEEYFAFRQANKCRRLTVADTRYASLYSSCAVDPRN